MVNESVPSSVADLKSLAIRGMRAMSRASIREVRVGALETTLLFSYTCNGELESQLLSEYTEFDAATAEPVSTKGRLRFAEDLVSLMHEKAPNHGTQHRKEEAEHVAAETTRAAAESNGQ